MKGGAHRSHRHRWRKAADQGHVGARCVLSVADSEDSDDSSVVDTVATVGDWLRNAADPECKEYGVTFDIDFHGATD